MLNVSIWNTIDLALKGWLRRHNLPNMPLQVRKWSGI
jgi:hypothetical protein